ncbi:MAG: hypothetical protein ACRDP7_45275 [Trebonia sp.]
MVLVTYGVVLRDAARLAEIGWGLVVADEAQHVKNPLSRTARELGMACSTRCSAFLISGELLLPPSSSTSACTLVMASRLPLMLVISWPS